MGVRLTDGIKKKIAIALLAVGVSGPSAYVAVNLTTPSESLETTPYADTGGLKTYCIGHLALNGETVKKEYSVDECVAIFARDWVEHERLLNSVVKVPYKSEWMKAALTDFTFNKGIGNVKSSTLLKKLNAKQYESACEELSRWVYGKIKGVPTKLPGLVIRASKQYSYCMGNEPSDYKSEMSKWGMNTIGDKEG